MVQRSLDSIVEYQLDRPPRGNWWPRVFCPYGFPMVIETEPFLEDGTPFPTLFWLTCPYLKEEISRMESGPVKVDIMKRIRQDRAASTEELQSEKLYSEYLKRQGFNRELYVGGSRFPLTCSRRRHTSGRLVSDVRDRSRTSYWRPCRCKGHS